MEEILLKTSSLNKLMPYRDIEKRDAYNKKYREEHRDALYKLMHTCGCGGSYRSANKARHERTQRHLEWSIREPIERQRILEERTNPDIAKLILEFVG